MAQKSLLAQTQQTLVTLHDNDGDGLTLAQEVYLGAPYSDTNANSIGASITDDQQDADGDGIPNLIEFQMGTDPIVPDTDGDGLTDGEENRNNNSTVDAGETDPRVSDTDGDSIPDGTEDSNSDGVVNAGETDPLKADTDGDGVPDASDGAATDPAVQ